LALNNFGRTRATAAVIALCVVFGGAGLATRTTMAQNSQIDLSSSETIHKTIEAQVGKRVKLKLVSGQDIEGQVARVGNEAVLLTELTGMEFFDATVRLNQVAAVIVRRAGK
jgi:hypothetical protein